MPEKTHWLQNPNKNYLGHWDLPENEDLILTIETAQWEVVENPVQRTKEQKRVIRFKEKFKPLICNETNAWAILKATWIRYMEDMDWKRIALYASKTKVMRDEVDCVRIRTIAPKVVILDVTKAIDKLNACKTLPDLQTVFMSLSNVEKADKKVITLKDNLKVELWKS